MRHCIVVSVLITKMITAILLFGMLSLGTALAGEDSLSNVTKRKVYVAIIIDDFGNNLRAGNSFINIPAPLTFAILPHTAHSETIARAAHKADKEIIIHLPMANTGNAPLGPGGLTASLLKEEFLILLDAAIRAVPFATGINNHMGSYLTQQSEQMNWLMDEMKRRDFFFIDSRTTEKSVAREVAEDYGVFTSSRDIFLDNVRTKESIDTAFQKMIQKAHQNGTAIAIGHPYPETLRYLKAAIPKLKSEGIELLPVSSLIAMQRINANLEKSLVKEQVSAKAHQD